MFPILTLLILWLVTALSLLPSIVHVQAEDGPGLGQDTAPSCTFLLGFFRRAFTNMIGTNEQLFPCLEQLLQQYHEVFRSIESSAVFDVAVIDVSTRPKREMLYRHARDLERLSVPQSFQSKDSLSNLLRSYTELYTRSVLFESIVRKNKACIEPRWRHLAPPNQSLTILGINSLPDGIGEELWAELCRLWDLAHKAMVYYDHLTSNPSQSENAEFVNALLSSTTSTMLRLLEALPKHFFPHMSNSDSLGWSIVALIGQIVSLAHSVHRHILNGTSIIRRQLLLETLPTTTDTSHVLSGREFNLNYVMHMDKARFVGDIHLHSSLPFTFDRWPSSFLKLLTSLPSGRCNDTIKWATTAIHHLQRQLQSAADVPSILKIAGIEVTKGPTTSCMHWINVMLIMCSLGCAGTADLIYRWPRLWLLLKEHDDILALDRIVAKLQQFHNMVFNQGNLDTVMVQLTAKVRVTPYNNLWMYLSSCHRAALPCIVHNVIEGPFMKGLLHADCFIRLYGSITTLDICLMNLICEEMLGTTTTHCSL